MYMYHLMYYTIYYINLRSFFLSFWVTKIRLRKSYHVTLLMGQGSDPFPGVPECRKWLPWLGWGKFDRLTSFFFGCFRQTKAEKKQKNCRVHEEYHLLSGKCGHSKTVFFFNEHSLHFGLIPGEYRISLRKLEAKFGLGKSHILVQLAVSF